MSQPEVYQEIQTYLGDFIGPWVSKWTLDRLTVLVSGILKGQAASPARIAQASQGLNERGVQAESLERRVRRIENDPKLQASTCFAPLVKAQLAQAHPRQLWLILDPSLQEDRVVLVSLNAWYRGRSLPLVWTIWPANQPLEGDRFWQRVAELLEQAAQLLPAGVRITVLADRAFGTPAFTDRVAAQGWHWIVRVQGQTHYRDRCGRESSLAELVHQAGQRWKGSGLVFKKAGWRPASVVVYWGRRYRSPLCLVSDQPAEWELIGEYRRRFSIEPSFRDWKSYGWQWEQGQVTCLEHVQRLLVGMAVATWLTVLVGAHQAYALLIQPPSPQRQTRPWWGKRSLFRLGLELWAQCFAEGLPPWLRACLPDWDAPNWSRQITAHSVHAFIFA